MMLPPRASTHPAQHKPTIEVARQRLNRTGKVDPRGVVNLPECADYAGKSNGMGTHPDVQVGEQLIGWRGSSRGREGRGTATFDHRFIAGRGGDDHPGGRSALHCGLLPFAKIIPIGACTTRQIIARGRWGT